MGDSRHSQNIQINKIIGENEKYVFYFMEKTKWAFWPTLYFTPLALTIIGAAQKSVSNLNVTFLNI